MPVGNIINRKSDYYVAMYSAHASIIENLIGEKGRLRKLWIDGGGLKAPRGSYQYKAIFADYLPEIKKTLHAKVIYLDKPRILSLWTGNLRKQTLSSQENIVITREITDKAGKAVKGWFATKDQKEHLIIHIANGNTTEVQSSDESIWKSCQGSLNRIKINADDKLSLYAFSPWGSSRFVKEIAGEISENNLSRLCLYTRQKSSEKRIWINTDIKNKHGLIIERYTKRRNTPFPHYKCTFITKKIKGKEKIIWAYIGSANLTEAAFFEKSNIEHAVFFEKPHKAIDNLFAKIKSRDNWEKHTFLKNSKDTNIDDSKDEFRDEYDNKENFSIRKHSKILCKKLKQRKNQNKLEEAYKKTKPLKIDPKYEIRVSSIHANMFDLEIDVDGCHFPLSIKRINFKEIHSQKDINDLMESFLGRSKVAVEDSRKITRVPSGSARPGNNSRNIRFPIFDFLSDKSLLKSKREILTKLKSQMHRLTDIDKAIVKIWAQIIEQWDKTA